MDGKVLGPLGAIVKPALGLGILALAACSAPGEAVPGEETATLASPVSAARPVQLRYANLVSRCAEAGAQGCVRVAYKVQGYVEVENLAYHKAVAIHGTWGFSNPWSDRSARYLARVTPHSEVWAFETEEEFADGDSGRIFRFAIRYSVDGRTYWDNNSGSTSSIPDYYVGSGRAPGFSFTMGNDTNVVLKEADVTNFNNAFRGSVWIRNIGYHKQVNVVYTTDNWVTVRSTTASYQFGPFPAESWEFRAAIPEGTQRVKFAISYSVNGATYWDNNFGRDYEYAAH